MAYTERELLERVKALCEIKHISVQSLEQATGMSNGTIRKWAVFFPRVDRLASVADYFGVSLDWLMGRAHTPLSPEALRIASSFDLADDRSRALARLALIDEVRQEDK